MVIVTASGPFIQQFVQPITLNICDRVSLAHERPLLFVAEAWQQYILLDAHNNTRIIEAAADGGCVAKLVAVKVSSETSAAILQSCLATLLPSLADYPNSILRLWFLGLKKSP
jgi:hypothetical protein